uniref:syntaxin-61-like n=1 Tax=Erigeron canadensis TaxID=72917 RepID=UPI001CB97473|nr:syntaxin-61-like [Erigeron canadensis]
MKAISIASTELVSYAIDHAGSERDYMDKNFPCSVSFSLSRMPDELKRLPGAQLQDQASHYAAKDNEDFISYVSDRQILLISQQAEELDDLSTSVEGIRSDGLTIHDKLLAQRNLCELGSEMDGMANSLDFVQRKVAVFMYKASVKGQLMMILFLIILFIVLFVLVFFT